MAKVVNAASTSTLEKCKALLQEVVTELNSSASYSEGIVPRPAGTGSDSIHNEHRRLPGSLYRGGDRAKTKATTHLDKGICRFNE